MRRNLESRYALAESIELCLEEHENDFAGDDALRAARSKLREQLRTVCQLTRDPRQPRKGLTGEKRKTRDLFVHALVEIQGIMHAWAVPARNERVRELTHNAAYRIHRLPDEVLRDVARETRASLEKHRRGLEQFGLEDGLRRAFFRLQKEFERALDDAVIPASAPEEVELPAMGRDEALEGLIRHIRDVLDPLVLRYQQMAPRFVRAYRSARRVVAVPEPFAIPLSPEHRDSVELLS